MSGDPVYLFIDTNGFLQLRDLKDLRWPDLFPKRKDIRLMIAPRVIEELDRFKVGTSDRKRNRARAALQMIEKASSEADSSLVIRDAPYVLRLVISNAPRFDWDRVPMLDPAKPDDQLVAEALSFGNGAGVLSHDTGPRIRARMAGIDAHAPPDDWLLPLEKSDEQREIDRLKRELSESRDSAPKISARLEGFDEETSRIDLIVPILPPLEPAKVNRLVENYLASSPKKHLQADPSAIALIMNGYTENMVQSYDAAYQTFETRVRGFVSSLHTVIASRGLAVSVGYVVKNKGTVSAVGLRLEFELMDGKGWLLADRKSAGGLLGQFDPPKPPKVPSRHPDFSNILGPSDFAHLHRQDIRDPTAFYWLEKPKLGSTHGTLQCGDFRAARKERHEIFLFPQEPLPATFKLRLHVSATNMRAPLDETYTVVVTQKNVEWSDPLAQSIMPPTLIEALNPN